METYIARNNKRLHLPLLASELFRILDVVERLVDDNLEYVDSNASVICSHIVLSIISVVSRAFDPITLIENNIRQAWLKRSQSSAKAVLAVDSAQEPSLQQMLDEAFELVSRNKGTLFGRTCRRGETRSALCANK